MADQLPLFPAQKQTAKDLPWYRAWLLSTGRIEAELEDEHGRPVTSSAR